MQGNLVTTLFAIVFYLASGLFGGNSASNQPVLPSGASGAGQSSIYPYAGTINSKQANIRNEASSGGQIVDTVSEGSRLLVLDAKSDWLKVQTESNKEGWIAKWMVKTARLTPGKTAGKVIAGYYVENFAGDPVGYTTLSKHLGAINTIIPFSFKVDQYGTISGKHNTKAVSLIRSSGGQTLALVNNIQGSNFNSNTIHRMLNSSSARARAVSAINRLLIEKGYQGVNIDFENVPARDRIYLTAFFRELAAALRPKGLLVTASVPAKTYNERSSSHSGAYDYAALAPYIDQLMIMAYDEHYSGGPAGPVASYTWVEKVIQYARQYYSSNKIVLGIAGYGYDWSGRSGKAKNYTAIQNLIKKHNVAPKWHSVYKVPYFTYKSWGITHQVWYENSHSTAAKMNLVKKYNLRGIALWRLGYEDPNIWTIIQQGM